MRHRMETNGKNWNRNDNVEMHSLWCYFCETWLLIHFHTCLAIGPICLSNQDWRSFVIWQLYFVAVYCQSTTKIESCAFPPVQFKVQQLWLLFCTRPSFCTKQQLAKDDWWDVSLPPTDHSTVQNTFSSFSFQYCLDHAQALSVWA